MGQKAGGLFQVDGVEGNGLDALDRVPYWVVCSEVPHNVFFYFCDNQEEEFGLQSAHPKQFSRVVGEESACLREGHAAFAQHVWIGCWAKTCWEPIHGDMERTKEE